MKKIYLITLLLLLFLINGCVDKTSKNIEIDVGVVYNIDNTKYDLKNIGYLKGLGDYYSISYSKDEQSTLGIGYYVSTDAFIECPEFSMSIFAVDKKNEDLLSELKSKITCNDVHKQELIIPLENFEHISQNLIDDLVNRFTIKGISGNVNPFIQGVQKCSEIIFKGNGPILTECVGEFENALTSAKGLMKIHDPKYSDYKGGILGKGEKDGNINILYIKKCSETNYIKINTISKEDTEELVKEIIDKLNC
tara:strand:- start:730 stop:1482 length:753 start_codon:yes stop_codon:yes gene_type:complete